LIVMPFRSPSHLPSITETSSPVPTIIETTAEPPPTLLPTSVNPVAPLTSAQVELLRLHARLGHMSMSTIQSMICNQQISTKIVGVANCRFPKCAACLYSKIRRKPWRTNLPPGSVKDSLMSMPCLLP
jgi:hypothetical protein